MHIIKKISPSEADYRTLAGIEIDPLQQANNFFDYSKVVVRKPWGYEYLIFQNNSVAVWILYIKEFCQTSMHCHRYKKTSVTVLSGEALCSTLEKKFKRTSGEGMFFGSGIFHRTKSISAGGTFVMEIETPVNKRDLIRFKDDYGREKMGYETKEFMSSSLHNYNYISFIQPEVYYNVKKKFGDHCSIELCKFNTTKEFSRIFKSKPWDTIIILKGKLLNEKRKIVLSVGDIISSDEIKKYSNLRCVSGAEAILVREIDKMIRLSDFVASLLKKNNVEKVFFTSDTSNAHLIDAIGRNTQIHSLSFKTENAASLAAEAYSKLTVTPSALIVSSGVLASNAIAGVANAWIDSIPLIVISAQSRSSELGVPNGYSIRQLASKELDIVNMVRSITKYAITIKDSISIRKNLEQAIYISKQSRCGPVWLDIPIDIQGVNIDEGELSAFNSIEAAAEIKDKELERKIRKVLQLLKISKRPVILAGYGIRAAGAQSEFIKLVKSLSIPVLTSRHGADLLFENFSHYFGRPGTYGQRAANFIIQNSDLLISIGTRLSLPLIGRNYKAFARAAKKVVVDVDPQELQKTTISIDLAINADAGKFIKEIQRILPKTENFRRDDWIKQCKLWKDRFPQNREFKHVPKRGVNPYYFVEKLSDVLDKEDIIVVDGGHSLDYVMQTFKVKIGQRIISSPGLECQGFALPGSIGVCMHSCIHNIICLCEMKGLQFNILELDTIAKNKLPIKIFVFTGKDNVRHVQNIYFGKRHVGAYTSYNPSNIRKLGIFYNIPTFVITKSSRIISQINSILASKGPVLCEVRLPEDFEIMPKLMFTVKQDGKWISKPLEDMYPYLSRKEFRENMIIDMLDEG